MDDLLMKEIEKTREASDRGRSVLLFMQVACIVVFMAAWHEVPNSWTFARLETARAAVWYLDCSPKTHPEIHGPEVQKALENHEHDECDYLTGQELSSPISKDLQPTCKPTENTPFCEDAINRAKTFLFISKRSPVQIRKYLDDLEASFVERTVNVSVPFLGITLDVNDLGLLGGISLLLFLTWLFFSLRRERENLRIVFGEENHKHLRDIYQLLSMTQVFTIPGRTKSNDASQASDKRQTLIAKTYGGLRHFLGSIPGRLLIAAPAGVEAFVVWNDRQTLPIGLVLNPLAKREFHWEVGLFGLILLLSILCISASFMVSHEWRVAHDLAFPDKVSTKTPDTLGIPEKPAGGFSQAD